MRDIIVFDFALSRTLRVRFLGNLVTWLSLVNALSVLASCEAGEPARLPILRLDPIPHVKVQADHRTSTKSEVTIDHLIDDLTRITTDEYRRMQPPPSGTVFFPIGTFNAFGDRLVKGEACCPASLRQLIEIGPSALPALLSSVNDKRMTAFTVSVQHEQTENLAMLWFDTSMPGNPVNPRDQFFLRLGEKTRSSGRLPQSQIESYRVKVGDLCFVAIGQIVGRDYDVLQHSHPKSGDRAILSTAHDDQLSAIVRDIWSSRDPKQAVLDSLLLDYSTRSAFQVDSLDDFYLANSIQVTAVMRLLYYYPSESAPFVAHRIDGFSVSKTEDFAKQCHSNGTRVDDFVDAVAWSKDITIRQALIRLAKRAEDLDVQDALRRARIEIPEKQ